MVIMYDTFHTLFLPCSGRMINYLCKFYSYLVVHIAKGRVLRYRLIVHIKCLVILSYSIYSWYESLYIGSHLIYITYDDTPLKYFEIRIYLIQISICIGSHFGLLHLMHLPPYPAMHICI